MKRHLFTIVCAVSLAIPTPVLAYKATLPGFQDVSWGEPSKSVVAKFKKKYKLAAYGNDGIPIFVGDFAGFRQCNFLLYFKAGRLYQVRVAVASQEGLNTIGVFSKLTRGLTQVYGPMQFLAATTVGQDDMEVFQSPHLLKEEQLQALAVDVLAMRKWLKAEWTFPKKSYITVFTVKNDEPNERVPLYVAVDYYSEEMLGQLESTTYKDY